MKTLEILKNNYELEHANSYFNHVESNWIEIVANGNLCLLNLNQIAVINIIDSGKVSIQYENGSIWTLDFDDKYDSLVDFINSKKVNL